MTRDNLIQLMAKAHLSYGRHPALRSPVPMQGDIDAMSDALAAIEAAGVRLVPVAITPLIGWHLESNLATCNPPSEIHAANWRDAWAAAVAASPYAPQKDERE